jgi:tetratricopeptide (TPR) repeat protein
MITNPQRRKQITEFIDKDHAVMHEFYEITETVRSRRKLKAEMQRLIEEDPLFFDPYLVLADVLFEEGKKEAARKLISDAYHKTVRLIADKNGSWPKEMAWGWLENRHIMRAIERYAYQVWEEGSREEALDIFRRLLRANPRDNQGARHSILAIRLGLGTDWEDQFLVKEGPMAGQALETGPLHRWFEENAKQFPEEFDWLLKLYKKWDEA